MKLAFFKKALVVIAAFTLSFSAWAAKQTVGGVEYTYTINGETATIDEVPYTTSGDVTIPNTLGGKHVTVIGAGAFEQCEDIESISFQKPVYVTVIEDDAFYGCISLTEFEIPDGVTSLGSGAFGCCYALESVSIPDSVTSIDQAFYNCTSLESVTIPDSVTTLTQNAFEGCTSLEEVNLPAKFLSADVMEKYFKGCPADLEISSSAVSGGLTWHFKIVDGGAELCYNDEDDETTIPDTTSGAIAIPDTLGGLPVVSIGEDAFYECDMLTSVTIPATVTSIGDWAFEDCSSMVLTVPDTVTSSGDAAFQGCDAMADENGFVIVRGVLHHYTDKDYEVVVPDGVTRIGAYAFFDCDVKGVTIPSSVTSIGFGAFRRCEYLEYVDIPASVTSIESGAFWGCESLADDDGLVIVRDVLYYYDGAADTVTIPSGVTEVSDGAFMDNTWVENVIFPASVTRIGVQAFSNCDALTETTIPSSVTEIGNYAFFDFYYSGTCPLKTVHVEAGDADRVKNLLAASRHNVDGIKFVQDVAAPCVVAFDANGGAVSPATRLVTKGATLGNLPEPVRPGFVCDGWFTAAVGGEQISSALVVNADATYYAHWTEIAATTWFTKRADAFAEARRTGKKVFMICGRDTCGNTMYTKNVACEDPTAKAKLIAKCVLWYTNCDTQLDENRYYWPTGTFTLPLVCIIDPANEKGFLKRATGPLEPADILALLADIPYPAAGSPALDPELIDPLNPGDLPWYTVLNARDISAPYIAQKKAETLRGAAYYGAEVMGVVELKIGKVSNKGTSKISGSVTTLAGKKYKVKAQSVYVDDKMAISVYLEVKGLGALAFALGSKDGKNVFAGALGKWHVQTANVGENWGKATATVKVDMSAALDSLPSGVQEGLLPTNEVAAVSGGKWKFAKAASVKWAKPKKGAALPDIYDAASGKGLIIDTSKGTNLSGLKLTYTPKKGTFKGSCKMYELKGSGSATKLKKYTVNVSGVVVDGVGYGKATCKSPVLACPVVVE